MNKILDAVAEQSCWLQVFAPVLLLVVWDVVQCLWDAYSRKQAYEELKLRNELREKGILTQQEFDEKKEALLLCG